MNNDMTYWLADVDVDVVLAALRLLQQTAPRDIPEAILDIAGDSLDAVDIDRLCERLNTPEQADHQDTRDDLIQRMRAELSRPEWDSDTAANLATALADAGWPPFLSEHEGWTLDVVNGAYAVVVKSDGPFRSDIEAVAAIARQFAAGSAWHGEVLKTIGMTACGEGLPSMRIMGLGPNSCDVVVANARWPERCLEVGYRRDHCIDWSNPESERRDPWYWAIFQRDPHSGEAQQLADEGDHYSALAFCAQYLDVVITDESRKVFASYFR
nr:hypothetical protein [uncultured Halomonas sp.]